MHLLFASALCIFLLLLGIPTHYALLNPRDACNGNVNIPYSIDPAISASLNQSQFTASRNTYPSTIHIGALILAPFPSFMPATYRGLELARDRLNQRPYFQTNGKTFVVHWRDDPCNANAAEVVRNAIDLVQQPKVLAFVGPTCSVSSVPVSFVSQAYQVPMLSTESTASSLSDKTLYPYFSRIMPPQGPLISSVVRVLKYYGWKRVNLIAPGDAFGEDFVTQFKRFATPLNIEVDLNLKFITGNAVNNPGTNPSIMTPLLRTNTRISILWTFDPFDFIELARWAADNALVGQGRVWIANSEAYQKMDETPGLLQASANVLQGWLNVETDREAAKLTQEYADFNTAWVAKYGNVPTGTPTDPAGPRWHDAFFAVGLAVEKVLMSGGDPNNGPTLLAALRSVNFTGPNGIFELNSAGDPIGFPVALNNYYVNSNGTYGFRTVATGIVDTNILNPSGNWVTKSRAVFPGYPEGTFTVPVDVVPFVYPEYKIADGPKIAVYVVSGIVGLLLLCAAGVLFVQRGSILVRASSRIFVFVVLFALLVCVGGANLYGYVPNNTSQGYVCHLRVWLTTMSIMCVLSVLVAKSFRINAIFGSRTFQIQVVTDQKLAVIVGTLMLVQIVMNIIFSALNMSEAAYVLGSGTTKETMVWQCNRQNGFDSWIGAQIAIFATLMSSAAIIAFKIRNTPTAFNESTHIMMCLFMMMFVLVIIVPLDYLVADSPEGAIVIQGIGQGVITLFLFAFLYGPKLYYIFAGLANDKQLTNPSTMKKSIGASSSIASSAGASSSHFSNTSAAPSGSQLEMDSLKNQA
jgi:ABC-type branched-subunit amino acid transport system substrate-binding protein